jgi:gamma-glutamyltranspeptidase/glutathione hydrolase
MNTIQSGGIPAMVVEGIPMLGSHATFTGVSGFMDGKLKAGLRSRCVIGSTMVLKDDRPICAFGTPGNVHCTIPQMLTYLLDFGMDPYQAVDSPRMLQLADDGSVTIEDRVSSATLKGLASMGIKVRAVAQYDWHMGSFQMCYRNPDTGVLGATADPRRGGVADGLR